MAVANFPTAPANGTTHIVDGSSYEYSTAKGVWRQTPLGTNSVTSDVKPGSPAVGDLWLDTTNLRQYVYFADSSGDSYWVDCTGGGADGSDGSDFSVLTADMDTGGFSISSSTDGNVYLDPNGTGDVVLKGSAVRGSGELQLNCEANTHGIKIKGPPHSANANYTITLPNNDGNIGQVLKTDGTGDCTWGSSGATTVSTFDDLKDLTGMAAGDMALVIATNKLYIYNSVGWFIVATVTNASPSAISGNNASYTLDRTGIASVVTVTATDPEGFDLTWSHSITATTGSAQTDIATITQNANVFTITPTTDSSYAGTFEITFNVTDNINGTVNSISSFGLSWSSNIPWQNSPATYSPMTLSSNQVSWQGTYPTRGLPITTPYGSSTVGNLPYVTLSPGRRYFEFSFARKSGHVGYAMFGLHFTPVWNQQLYTVSGYTATHWSANAGLLFKAMNAATSSSGSTPMTDGGYLTLHGKKDDSNSSLADYSSGTYDGTAGSNSLELAQGATTDSSGRVRIGVAYDTSTRRMWFSRAGAWDWIRGYNSGYISTTLDPATTNGMSIDSAASGTDLRMYLLAVGGNITQGHVYFYVGSDLNHLPTGFASH
tara:strand:+ start:964 stop:2766 length:1803 start_codon:yes stop_codon:yes gene_type:complete